MDDIQYLVLVYDSPPERVKGYLAFLVHEIRVFTDLVDAKLTRDELARRGDHARCELWELKDGIVRLME